MSENNRHCCCSDKNTMRTEEQKKKLLNRLKRIEGQIRGIQSMIEDDAYCHIHTCVARDIRDGKDEVIDELVTTLQKLMR